MDRKITPKTDMSNCDIWPNHDVARHREWGDCVGSSQNFIPVSRFPIFRVSETLWNFLFDTHIAPEYTRLYPFWRNWLLHRLSFVDETRSLNHPGHQDSSTTGVSRSVPWSWIATVYEALEVKGLRRLELQIAGPIPFGWWFLRKKWRIGQ